MDQKSTLLCQVEARILTIFGVEKVYGLFQSSLGSILRHFFRTYKAYSWVYFQLETLIYEPKNHNFRLKICSFCRFWWVIFDYFVAQKNRSWLFKSCIGRIFLRLKRHIFGCIFSSKGWQFASKKLRYSVKKNARFCNLESHFWQFWGSKRSFSALFQSYLGVVKEVFRYSYGT